MKCDRCGKEIIGEWISRKTYEGIDYHHNPPKFMLEDWKGEILYLCRKHHKELHIEINKILFKNSNLFKPNKSDYWTWIKIPPIKRKDVIKEIKEFTKKWRKEDDTKTII